MTDRTPAGELTEERLGRIRKRTHAFRKKLDGMKPEEMMHGVRWSAMEEMTAACETLLDRIEAQAKELERIRGAIETLVVDEVISAGKAIELHGMSHEQQREHWRDRCTRLVPIWLTITPEGHALVSVEWEGRWIPVIEEMHAGGVTSHIVEQSGIRGALRSRSEESKA